MSSYFCFIHLSKYSEKILALDDVNKNDDLSFVSARRFFLYKFIYKHCDPTIVIQCPLLTPLGQTHYGSNANVMNCSQTKISRVFFLRLIGYCSFTSYRKFSYLNNRDCTFSPSHFKRLIFGMTFLYTWDVLMTQFTRQQILRLSDFYSVGGVRITKLYTIRKYI